MNMTYYKSVTQLNFVGFFDLFRIASVTVCYYKVRQVLQSVTDFLQSANIVKCDSYYKVRRNIPPKYNRMRIH